MSLQRLSTALLLLLLSSAAFAQDRDLRESNQYYNQPLSELMRIETQPQANVGSRADTREALAAEVPIDVITGAQLQATGASGLMQALTKLVPGFNAPRPSITDGTDHAPPFTLRGLNPDQLLVLVNGKRQHTSSLMHANGTIGRGSSGVDLNTIPLLAIERVEVLRDGAAAQYGSDAIAGIINIILKGYGQRNEAAVTWGQTHQGDGQTRQAELLLTHPLAQDGFINLTTEWRDRGASNRAGPDAQDGNRINTHFGDPDTQDALLALNVEVPHGDTLWYLHGTLDRRNSSAGAFFRRASDERNLTAIYPNGFLPLIEPKIDDYAFSSGFKGVLESGTHWDVSYTQGHNQYQFLVNHSLNRSLGLSTPTAFDSGQTRYTQQILNLDLNRPFGAHNLAGGLEFRQESYGIDRGDEASYAIGPESAWYVGAQGFGGFMPNNEVSAKRHNLAAYLDGQYALRDGITLDAAVRAERYSDFGATLNGKLALRVQPSQCQCWLLRSSVSSGFRAPSLAQSHFTSTATVRDGESILQYGTFGVDHPVARALGATDLKPEKSQHFTMGTVYQPHTALALSADVFLTDIDDRIMPTGYIAKGSLAGLSPQGAAILTANQVDGAVYFTNAVSTRTQGLDLRLDYKHAFADSTRLKLAGAYHRSSTRITAVNAAPSVLGVAMTDLILDANTRMTMARGQPQDSIKLWGRYETSAYDLVLNLNRFGAYSSTIGNEPVDFGAKWTLDAELNYRLRPNLSLTLGGENLFNAMPDEWGQTTDSLLGSGKIIRYSQYAPFGYNGRRVYVRLGLQF